MDRIEKQDRDAYDCMTVETALDWVLKTYGNIENDGEFLEVIARIFKKTPMVNTRYVKKSLFNAKIGIHRKKIRQRNFETELFEDDGYIDDSFKSVEIISAIETLPPNQREAIKARMQGYSCTEIAEMRGISRQAADRLVCRARRNLKKEFLS